MRKMTILPNLNPSSYALPGLHCILGLGHRKQMHDCRLHRCGDDARTRLLHLLHLPSHSTCDQRLALR